MHEWVWLGPNTHTDFSARSIIIKSPTWAPVPLEGAISFILYAYSIYIYLCPLSLRSTFAKLGTYHRGNRSKFSMSYIQTPWGPSTHSTLKFFWKNPLFKFRAVHFSLIQSWLKDRRKKLSIICSRLMLKLTISFMKKRSFFNLI